MAEHITEIITNILNEMDLNTSNKINIKFGFLIGFYVKNESNNLILNLFKNQQINSDDESEEEEDEEDTQKSIIFSPCDYKKYYFNQCINIIKINNKKIYDFYGYKIKEEDLKTPEIFNNFVKYIIFKIFNDFQIKTEEINHFKKDIIKNIEKYENNEIYENNKNYNLTQYIEDFKKNINEDFLNILLTKKGRHSIETILNGKHHDIKTFLSYVLDNIEITLMNKKGEDIFKINHYEFQPSMQNIDGAENYRVDLFELNEYDPLFKYFNYILKMIINRVD